MNVDEDKWNKCIVDDNLTDIGLYLQKGGTPPISQKLGEEDKQDEEAKMETQSLVNLGEKLLMTHLGKYREYSQ